MGDADPLPLSRVEDLFEVSGEGGTRRAATHVISSPSVYGGQLFGLAVVAAAESAGQPFRPVSMHAQLLDRGIAGEDVDLAITDVRDGRSSRHRSMVMSQGGRAIAAVQLALALPSEVGEAPEEHDATSQQPPDSSGRLSPFVTRWGFDQLDLVHAGSDRPHPMWVRPRVALPDDPVVHAAALAFISDIALVLAADRPSDDRASPPLTVDHAIWFHGSPRFDDWVLLDATLAARHGDYGLVSAAITDVGGRPLATMAQGVGYKRARPKPAT